MAFSNAPSNDTYSSHQLSATYGIDARKNLSYTDTLTLLKDQGMINLLPYKTTDEMGNELLIAEERPGIKANLVVSGVGEQYSGGYVWEKINGQTYFFVVSNTKIYTSTDMVTWTNVSTFTNLPSIGFCGFTEFIDSTNVKKLIVVNGTEGFVFTSNLAGTKIVDVDFPSPHLPFPVFVDGYLFLAKTNTGDIYNSNLNDPALWTAGDFISSELYPDDLKALVKVNNYILAVGRQGCEYFYDAGNATGTPLARYEGGNLPFGTSISSSIASNLNTVVLLAQNDDGGLVLKVIEDFKAKEIPASFLISALTTLWGTTPFVTSYLSLRAFLLRYGGDLYYVVTPQPNGIYTSRTNMGYAFSLSTGLWTSLTDFGDNTRFTMVAAYPTDSNATVPFVGGSVVSAPSNVGDVYFGTLGPSYYTSSHPTTAVDVYTSSAGTTYPINTQIRTPNLTFGTMNFKMMSRFGVRATFNTYPGTALSVNVKWTDDDFQSYSTTYPLYFTGTGTSEFPFITQLGRFRNRTMVLDYSGSSYIRYYYLETDINKGQQ